MALQHPVVEGSVEEVQGRFYIGVCGDLAALDRAREDDAGWFAARLDEADAIFLGELRILIVEDPPGGSRRTYNAPLTPSPGGDRTLGRVFDDQELRGRNAG